MSGNRSNGSQGEQAAQDRGTAPASAWMVLLLALALGVAGLVAARPAPARAAGTSAGHQQHLWDVRSAHPDAVIATNRGEVLRRGGDDVPALLAAVADHADARTFARGLGLLLEAQGQVIGVAQPARNGRSAGGAGFQQIPAQEVTETPTGGTGDHGDFIPFVGQSAVIGDVSGDDLDDVVRWSQEEEDNGAIEVVRGIDGTTVWQVGVAVDGHHGISLQPLADTTGDGVPDLLTITHLFDEEASSHDCDGTGCVGSETFTWIIQLRDGTSGEALWEVSHEGSNDYEDDFGGVEQRSRRRTVNGVVPYQPLQDVTGDGVGDFLVTLTDVSEASETSVEGQYPGIVTERSQSSGTATTTVRIVSGADASVVLELTEGETDSVLGGRAVPDTTGDGVPDVLLTRRDLSSHERTCTTEGTTRTCTEAGSNGGLTVELRDSADLQEIWEASYPVQEGVASSPGDLTGDGVRDVVVQAHTLIGEGILAVLDGGDGEEVWSEVAGPAHGYGYGYGYGESMLAVTPLQDDGALDLLSVRHHPEGGGELPQLEIVRRDGATGAQLLVTEHGTPAGGEEQHVFTYASSVDDADGDGSADVLLTTERFDDEGGYSVTSSVESGRTGEQLALLPQHPQHGRYYRAVGDLDGDGGTDAVAFDDPYQGDGEEPEVANATAVRLRDGAVLWERPTAPNTYVYGVELAQLDADAGGDLLLTQERYSEVYSVRQIVALDGEDGATLWTHPAPAEVRRVAGGDRIATAVALSQITTPTATTVVVARADDFPDALAGGPLAMALEAPLLLTGSGGLDASTAAEIVRLGATQAVLLGGTSALSEQVAADLAARGVAVERLAGDDRYATAGAIADRVAGLIGPLERVAIAAGGQDGGVDASGQPVGWVDAILASAYGAATDAPLLLVRADALPTATTEALQRLAPTVSTMLVGDGVAIDGSVEQQIRDLTARPTERLSAEGPSQTSHLVARFAMRDGAAPQSVWVATSVRFPDALAASAAVGSSGGVLLLTDGSEKGADAALLDFVARVGPVARHISLVGGTAAIPAATQDRVADAVSLD